MSETAERLRLELTNLSDCERAEMASLLIKSLDPGSDNDAASAWDMELARRVEEIESGRAVGIPAEKVFAELRAKYS